MWLAAATQYYPWRDDEREYPIGPEVGFKDMVRARREAGLQRHHADRLLPQLGDRPPACVGQDRGRHGAAPLVARARQQPRPRRLAQPQQGHAQRRRPPLRVSRARPRLRGHHPGHDEDQPEVLPVPRQAHRLLQRARDHPVPRAVAARLQPGVVEVLRLAGDLHQVHRLRLRALPREQHLLFAHPPRHARRLDPDAGLQRPDPDVPGQVRHSAVRKHGEHQRQPLDPDQLRQRRVDRLSPDRQRSEGARQLLVPQAALPQRACQARAQRRALHPRLPAQNEDRHGRAKRRRPTAARACTAAS